MINLSMKKTIKGQIALIVLLVLVVMLTVGLAVISRTITEIKISEHQKESVRAFSAAEAGIEEVLKDISLYVGATNQPIDVVGDLQTRVTVAEIKNNIEEQIKKNGSIKIDLNGAEAALNRLTIYWVKSNDSEENTGSCSEDKTPPASLEIIVYVEDGGSYSARRYAYNSCDGLTNGFDSATPDDGGPDFLKKVEIDVTSGKDKLVNIRSIYNKTTVRVVGNENLPVQQYKITSRAVAEGGEAKAVEVSKTVSVLPEIFDYVLFSGGDLVK